MGRWSDALVKGKHPKGVSWNKGQKTAVDGYNFPSKLHAAVYCQLKLLQAAGLIDNIRAEVTVPICGKLKLRVDFVVFDLKRKLDVAHEAKGAWFPRFRAIVQAWDGVAPMDLVIWEGSWRAPIITKIIKGQP